MRKALRTAKRHSSGQKRWCVHLFAGLAGMSHRTMAAELNALGFPTLAGGQWHAVTVKRVLKRIGG